MPDAHELIDNFADTIIHVALADNYHPQMFDTGMAGDVLPSLDRTTEDKLNQLYNDLDVTVEDDHIPRQQEFTDEHGRTVDPKRKAYNRLFKAVERAVSDKLETIDYRDVAERSGLFEQYNSHDELGASGSSMSM